MPTPQFKGKANEWKQQRGTVYGTDEDGLDYVELTFRGPSSTGLTFRSQYPKGTACPEPGFGHCFLVTPPEISEDSIGFSSTTLRFEGPHGGADESEGANIQHTTQEADLVVITKTNGEDKDSIYKYHRAVITVNYTKATRPTGTKYDSETNKHETPTLFADEKRADGMRRFNVINDRKEQCYERKEWHVVQSWTEEGNGTFKVTEEHCVYLAMIEDSHFHWKK